MHAARVLSLLSLVAAAAACAPRPDPRVQAARDFQSTAFDLIEKDEKQMARLNSLRLGMSDADVLTKAGSPTRRESRKTSDGHAVEVWTYNGQLKSLGTLTFEDQRLVELKVN